MKKLLPLSDFMRYDIKAQLSAETMKKKIDFPAIPLSYTFIQNTTISCSISSNETHPAAPYLNFKINQIPVNQKKKPAIAFNSDNQHICSGTAVNFTAQNAEGVVNPFYQWNVNRYNQTSDFGIFPDNLNNSDKVLFVMTPSLPCALQVTSNMISMNVIPTLTSSHIISRSSNVCTGISTIFTACPIDADYNPLFAYFEINVVHTEYSTTPANDEIIPSNQSIANGGLSVRAYTISHLGPDAEFIPIVISAKRSNQNKKSINTRRLSAIV